MIKLRHPASTYMAVILICLLAGCSGLPTPPQKPELQTCVVGENFPAECGRLSVFEDRGTQTGRKIDLQLAVIKARSDQPAPDPIFVLAGGPGTSAIEWASYYMQLLGPANYLRDVVLVDQRGTGGSNKLECPDPGNTDPDRRVEALRSCLASLNGDPRAYTTVWAMDDLEDVRVALGYDQINLYGGSYGTTAAEIYILRHGEHVRTVALDGATLLDVPIFERWPITSQNALDSMFARCESENACHSAFPDLRQEFTEVLARLDRAPVTVPIDNPATGQPLVLTAEVFKTTVHNALTSTPTAVFVPRLIHLLYTEDWSGLVAFLAPFMDSDSSAPQWQIMNLTILCYEDWAKMRPDEIARASAASYLKYEDVRALTVPEEICAALPPPETEALDYGPLMNSPVPILFFNGELDPQDPPQNVASARGRYPDSLTLVAPGQAHGFTGIPCRASIVADFITQGSTAGLQTDCLERVELPAIDTGE
jgi:pimeloyl-ACP methyl ester carboxylesterase